MKITKIEVENFRSIETYNFSVSDFNIFVGQNNHGKTNLFDALDWFDSGKIKTTDYHNYNTDLVARVRVHYDGVQETLDELQNDEYRNAIKNKVNDEDSIANSK